MPGPLQPKKQDGAPARGKRQWAGYLRQDRDASDLLTTTTPDLGGGVLLQTSENIGHGHDTGLELMANGDLSKTLSLKASTDLMHSEVSTSNSANSATPPCSSA
jgi:hypothetical protein